MARANNLRVVVLLFARDTGAFFEDAKHAVDDLIFRHAYPTDWASNQYASDRTSSPCTPIGDERNASSGNYTALRLAEFENGFPVTSATTNSTFATRNPQYLIDGDLMTNYGSIDQIGQYYQFDLGASKPVHGVGLAFYLGTSRDYTVTVQTSPDGTTWTNHLTNAVSTRQSGVEDLYFNVVNARYVRVVNGGNTTNNSLALYEARTLGWHSDTTYVGNLTATAPNAQAANPAANLVDKDENFTTRCALDNLNDYMQIDLGTTHTLKGVTVAVYSGDTRAQRFDVQVSANGTSFTTVLTGAQTTGAWLWNEDFRFPTQQSALRAPDQQGQHVDQLPERHGADPRRCLGPINHHTLASSRGARTICAPRLSCSSGQPASTATPRRHARTRLHFDKECPAHFTCKKADPRLTKIRLSTYAIL